MQIQLKYPSVQLRMRKQQEQLQVFDEFRKKWLQLSPEEFVRQQLLHHLVSTCKYPAASIAIEKALKLNDTLKRFDIVVFNRNLQPFLVIECKAPYIPLDQAVVEQALRYNLILKAPYVMISNGVSDYVYTAAGATSELPLVTELIAL